eukprot:scaffold600776_cov59-Attheya_sp.AAC.2
MAGHRQATVTFRAIVGFGRNPFRLPKARTGHPRTNFLRERSTWRFSGSDDQQPAAIKRFKIVFNWYSWPSLLLITVWSNRGLYKNQYRRSLPLPPVNEYYVHSLLDVLDRDTGDSWSGATRRVVWDVISRMSRCE